MHFRITLTTLIFATILFADDNKDEFEPSDYNSRIHYAHRLDQPLQIDGILEESLYDQNPINTFI
ncbi:MAG: hypothetical protein HQ509_04515, partial [Candidatus Marinimicrobia bacterium]|nr:hypothetical protein [Candidatus Neomarinimicrobiota bacterium]